MMTGEDIKILHEGPSLISFRGAFDAVGSTLPSNPPRLFSGLVAQLVEQCPFKALVQGSSPCQPTISPGTIYCHKEKNRETNQINL